ncbi:hypothetical protein ACFFUT_13290 [Pseudohalocynthiibacter aestuariivivens]|uniref:Porin family protein n=1 Tax=Pseudohalocynthiibacter aestuariivivens TaxID=1591409 RepID=A0ABV5JI11_9RHOB|nr:hypothetical protein [Pseudohalocynthiibacter aestuariivivens]MBS9718449.1 hypothetical protein [Pseudohalocynthiibacter aestuariivivens]
MTRFIVFVLSIIIPFPAFSGAWPREHGTVYVAFSETFTVNSVGVPRSFLSLYAEYGLSPQLTLGFDGFRSGSGESSETFLFLSFPLHTNNPRNHYALTFALGEHADLTGAPAPALRIGLNWGRNIGSSWLAINNFATFRKASDTPLLKLDATWGYHFSNHIDLMLNLRAETYDGATNKIEIAPGLTWQTGVGNRIEVGLSIGAAEHREYGLKIGIVREF